MQPCCFSKDTFVYPSLSTEQESPLRTQKSHGSTRLLERGVLRFTDRAALPSPSGSVAVGHAPEVPAGSWLQQQGWERVWPLFVEGRSLQMTLAGPPEQGFLRVSADTALTIWAHRLTVDPQHYPWLAITWAVERFPVGAALDLPGRNDRAMAVVVALGPPIPSGGLRPAVPRGFAFFWGKPTRSSGPTPVSRRARGRLRNACSVSIPRSSTSRYGRAVRERCTLIASTSATCFRSSSPTTGRSITPSHRSWG